MLETKETLKRKIVIADDNDHVLSDLSRIFKYEGYEVITFSNGEDLLEALKESLACDAVITDFNFNTEGNFSVVQSTKEGKQIRKGNLTGLGVLLNIRQLGLKCPVFLHTMGSLDVALSSSNLSEEDFYDKYGGTFMSKGLDVEEKFKLVENAIKKSKT